MDIKRLPRQIIGNLDKFDYSFPDDSTIVKHILYALSYDLQSPQFPETLWGFKQIDPYKLAPLIGFSVKSLINPAERPLQFAGMTAEEISEEKRRILTNGGVFWTTKLDNAFWILWTKHGTIQDILIDKERQVNTSKIVGTEYLPEVVKHSIGNRRNKTIYEVKTSDLFQKQIASNFSKYDHDILITLPIALRNLYLSLVNRRESIKRTAPATERVKGVEITPYFDLIARWVNATNFTNQRDKKSKINKDLAKLNEIIFQKEKYEFLKVEWDYYKPTITLFYRDEEIDLRNQESTDRFEIFLLQHLKDKFRHLYPPREIDTPDGYNFKMKLWINDHDKDLSIKQQVISKTQLLVFPNAMNNIEDKWFKTMREVFPRIADQIPIKSMVVHYGS